MRVKPFLPQRILIFILFVLLGLLAPLGVQALSPEREATVFSFPVDSLSLKQLTRREDSTQNPSLLATTIQLLEQGKAFYEAGQYSEAARIWQQTADSFAAQGDTLKQASALSNLSLSYQQLGQWEPAKNAIAQSLTLLNNPGNKQDSALILAQTLNIQGRLQLSMGQVEDALTTLQKATAIYQKAGDEAGITSSLINQAQAMQALGFYRRAANTLEDVEKRLQNQPDSMMKVTGLLSLGNTLQVLGDLNQSQKVLQQSLQVAQKLPDQNAIASIQLSLGNTQRAIAKKSENVNKKPQAQSEIQAALNYYQQAATTSTARNTRIQALLNQLSLLVETEQDAAAQALIPEIQRQLNDLPPSRTAVYARINLAQSLTKMGQQKGSIPYAQDAAQLLAKAIGDAKSLQDRRAESNALGSLGEVYEINQQWSNAQDLTQQALLLAQAMNASDIAYRWQWQLGRLLKVQGKNGDAIAAYTEAVNTLKFLRKDLVAINPDVQFSFRETVEPVYRQLVALLLQPEETGLKTDKNSSPSQVSQKNLIQARQLIESLQLAELDNFFQEACLNAKPELIDQVDKTAAIIYPIILSDRLDVILSLPQQPLRYYSTKLPQNEVETILEQLRLDLTRPSSRRQRVLNFSQQLYNWLIRPSATEIKNSGVKTLVFVLDGSLRNIPMAVLHDGQQYIMEQYSLAVAPGLQLLAPRSLSQVALKALKVGLSESREGFPPLPAVESELKRISTLLPGTVLLNQQFTGTTLQSQLNAAPFSIVHLATHGKFSSNAEGTFILAWDGRINVKQLDEFLRVSNQDRSRVIELLVLSACETAAGDKRATLGLAGVAVRAGARSTLATLWPVKDNATANLMTQFYQELETNIGKAEALRRAQVSLSQNFKHPYYWAPYVLVGNWL